MFLSHRFISDFLIVILISSPANIVGNFLTYEGLTFQNLEENDQTTLAYDLIIIIKACVEPVTIFEKSLFLIFKTNHFTSSKALKSLRRKSLQSVTEYEKYYY